jgi:hypothetical protein
MNVEFVNLPGGVLDELLCIEDIRADCRVKLYNPSDVLGETIARVSGMLKEDMFLCCKEIDDVRGVVSDLIAYCLQEYVVWNDCTVGRVADRIAGLLVKVG